MNKDKLNLIIGLILLSIISSVIIIMFKLLLDDINTNIIDDSECYRMNINEFEDNCICPCTSNLCDAWNVPKNKSCYYQSLS